MRPCRLVALALAVSIAPATAQDSAKPPQWRNHESLQTVATAEADWQPVGKGSMDITAQGLLLPGNSRIESRFQLLDGASIRFLYTASNRNGVVRLCGKEVKAMSPNRRTEWFLLEISRKGRELWWGVSAADALGRTVGPAARLDAKLMDESEAGKPSRVVFGSQPVTGRGDSNSVGDVRLKSIVVAGPVVPPDAAKAKAVKK